MNVGIIYPTTQLYNIQLTQPQDNFGIQIGIDDYKSIWDEKPPKLNLLYSIKLLSIFLNYHR